MAQAESQRRRVFYEGRVQGVGFRYNARAIARRHDVAGFVRNLPDGRVELVVEANEAELDAFLGAIDESMGEFIRDRTVDSLDASGEFDRFEIRP